MLYKNNVKKHFPDMVTNIPLYDVIYVTEPNTWYSTVKNKELKNTSMACIHGIHKDKKANSQWETIKGQKEITVSIDLFYCGILFFRKEQVKEHFKIRC